VTLVKRLVVFSMLLVLTGCVSDRDDLLLYGIVDQNDGVVVIHVSGGRLQRLAKANELRPAAIKEDWSRSLVGLRPIWVQGGFLYYHLPAVVNEDSQANASRGGIYRKQLDSQLTPELLVETPKLKGLHKRAGSSKVIATTENNELLMIDMSERSVRPLNVEPCSFASWVSNGRHIVAGAEEGKDVLLIDSVSGKVERTEPVGADSMKRIFAVAGGNRYVFQNGSAVSFYDVTSKTVETSKISAMSLISDLYYDDAIGTAYALVPNDRDGSTVVAVDIKANHVRRLVRGVLTDSVTGN